MATASYITERDVRLYMMDRSAADHIVLPDVAWTSEEIQEAMKIAARKYNGMRPMCHTVQANQLPDWYNFFFDAIAASLLEIKVLNASMNDVDYQGGNISASVQGKLIQNLRPLIDFYNRRFSEQATAYKLSINLQDAFGQIG
jgi:hypothetical protein